MAQGLEWVFSVIDKSSAPLKQIDKGLRNVQKGLAGTERALAPVEKAATSFFQALGRGAGAAARGVQSAGSMIGGMLKKLISLPAIVADVLGAAGGKFVLDGIRWRENVMTGLSLYTKTQQDASALMNEIAKMSRLTGISMDEIGKSFTGLLQTGGVKTGKELESIVAHMARLSQITGGGPQQFAQTMDFIQRTLARGIVSGGTIRQLASMNVNVSQYTANLAKIKGVKPDEIPKLVEKQAVSAREGVLALQMTIRQMDKGMDVGEGLKANLQTVDGAMTGFALAIKDFPKTLNAKEMRPAMQPFIDFMNNMTALFTNPVLIKAVQDLVSVFMKEFFGPLAKATGPKNMETFLTSLTKQVPKIKTTITEMGKSFQKFILNLEEWVKKIPVIMGGFSDGFKGAFGNLQGMWKTIEPVFTALRGNVSGVGTDSQKAKAPVAEFAGALMAYSLVAKVIGPVIPLIQGLGKAIQGLMQIKGGPWIMLAIAIAASLVWLYKNVKWFRDAVDAVWNFIKGLPATVAKAWDAGVKAIGDAINWITKEINKFWDWLKGIPILGKVFEGMEKGVKALTTTTGTASVNIADNLNKTGDKAAAASNTIGDQMSKNLSDSLNRTITTATAQANTIGNQVSKGVADGITAGAAAPIEATNNLADQMAAMWGKKTESGSPSRLFARLAQSIPEGISQGVSSGMGDVAPSIDRALDALKPSAVRVPLIAPARAPAPARVTPAEAAVSLVFNISGAREPQAVAHEIRDQVVAALGDVFERLAFESGALPVAAG